MANKVSRKTNISLPLHLLIFLNHDTKPSKSCREFKSCIAFNRLLLALKYNTLLKPQINQNNQQIFVIFMKEVYKHQIIDDLCHFKHCHGDQLIEMEEYLVQFHGYQPCDLNLCEFANRHYRVNSNHHNNHNDPYFIFYQDIIDSFHYYLYHLFHAGFRIKSVEIQQQNEQDEKTNSDNDDNDEYYDVEFEKRKKIISNTREKTQRFKRISNQKTQQTKFNIQSDQMQYEENAEEFEEGKEGITYLDTVYQKLYENHDIKKEEINNLIHFVLIEEYDTESVDLDLQIKNNIGNIEQFVNNFSIINSMKVQFNETKRMLYVLCIISCILYNIYCL